MEETALFKRFSERFVNKQFLRYLFVGVWNTLFGYGCFCVMTWLFTGVFPYPYMIANVLANIISITVAFLGYKLFVFRTRGNYLREYLRCYVVYGTSALLGLVLLPFAVAGVSFFLVEKEWAPYIAGALLTGITMLISFLGHKHYSFHVPVDHIRDTRS